jgi:hypothetical protein
VLFIEEFAKMDNISVYFLLNAGVWVDSFFNFVPRMIKIINFS